MEQDIHVALKSVMWIQHPLWQWRKALWPSWFAGNACVLISLKNG